ncbi:glycosyltransferase [Candidatus Bathyarchaeota archaeon]|nr:MAG: glycosyltransferase [Candidatus Bathyarchaeota archaeon]
MEKPSISVIIPAKNSERTIGKCLRSVFNQEYVPQEVIVVDGGSTDRTRSIANKYGARVVIEPPHKRSAPGIGRNHGAKSAQGDILAFLDSDCYPEKKWLNRVVEVFRDPKTGVCSIVVSDGTGEIVSRAFHYLHMGISYDFAPSRCMAIRRNVFMQVNGFDETLTTGEDNDLSYRVRQLGYEIIVDKESKVYHDDDHMTDIRGIWRQQIWYRESEAEMRRRYPNKFRKFKTAYPLKEHLVPLAKSIRFGVRFAVTCLIIKLLSLRRHIG